MDVQSTVVVTMVVALFLLKTSSCTRHSIITRVIDGVNASQGGETEGLTLMNLLATHYTPSCLKIVILPKEAKTTRFSEENYQNFEQQNISARTPNSPFLMDSYVFIYAESVNQVQKTLEIVNSNIGSIASCTHISYIVSVAQVSSFLASLTAMHSSIHVTQYIFFYMQNLRAAEHLLLDPHLAEEENVAAVIQDFHSTTLWSVLTRQLLHPSGSPQVLKANTWSRYTGFTSTQEIFRDQMKNFYGKKLKGSVMVFSPFIMFEKIEGSLVVKPKPSLEVYILRAIAHQLNFTFVLALPEDGQWGSPTADVSSAVIFSIKFRLIATNILHTNFCSGITRSFLL